MWHRASKVIHQPLLVLSATSDSTLHTQIWKIWLKQNLSSFIPSWEEQPVRRPAEFQIALCHGSAWLERGNDWEGCVCVSLWDITHVYICERVYVPLLTYIQLWESQKHFMTDWIWSSFSISTGIEKEIISVVIRKLQIIFLKHFATSGGLFSSP